MLFQPNAYTACDDDLRLAADAQRLQVLFGDSAHRGLRRVHACVRDGRVLLSGTVSSYYLKQMAQEQARQACPNLKLSNDVVVQASV